MSDDPNMVRSNEVNYREGVDDVSRRLRARLDSRRDAMSRVSTAFEEAR